MATDAHGLIASLACLDEAKFLAGYLILLRKVAVGRVPLSQLTGSSQRATIRAEIKKAAVRIAQQPHRINVRGSVGGCCSLLLYHSYSSFVTSMSTGTG